MKRNRILPLLSVSILSIVTFVSCTKDKQPGEEIITPEKIRISVDKKENYASSTSKTTYTFNEVAGSINIDWDMNDGLSVIYHDKDLNKNNIEQFSIEKINSAKTAVFISENTFDATKLKVDKAYIYYPQGVSSNSAEYDIAYDISDQTGKLSDLGKYDLMKGEIDLSNLANSKEAPKAELNSYISIVKLAKGTIISPATESNDSELNISFSFKSDDIATKVSYKGGVATYDGNTVTLNNVATKNGALLDDLYITFISKESSATSGTHEYLISSKVSGTDPTNYTLQETKLQKVITTGGEYPFSSGLLYTLENLEFNVVEENGYIFKYLTFEDEDYVGSDKDKTWSKLIDEEQYNGPLLYENGASYSWHDENNTELYSAMSSQFWSGGEAISNYVEMSGSADYTKQLAVPYDNNGLGTGGYKGSKNFAIHFGYGSYNSMGIAFEDDIARIIDHMYVLPTAYLADCIVNGNGFTSQKLDTDGFYFKIIAKGYNGSTEVGSKEFYIAKDGVMVTEWTKWDLSELGEVTSIVFDCDGSDTGQWGLNTPGYFAYDNVAVKVKKN